MICNQLHSAICIVDAHHGGGAGVETSSGDDMTSQNLKHSTLVFERVCAAPVERVFAAFASPQERAGWGTPSETAALIYDKADFREGGVDVFRCGDKSN